MTQKELQELKRDFETLDKAIGYMAVKKHRGITDDCFEVDIDVSDFRLELTMASELMKQAIKKNIRNISVSRREAVLILKDAMNELVDEAFSEEEREDEAV